MTANIIKDKHSSYVLKSLNYLRLQGATYTNDKDTFFTHIWAQ